MNENETGTASNSGSERSVPPENYSLWDEEREEYRCPFCNGRMLRIGDYAECTDCGERFQRSGSDDDHEQSKLRTDGGTAESVSTRFDVHGMGRFTVELKESPFGLRIDHGHSDRVMLMGLPKSHGWRAITAVHLPHQSYVEKAEDWLEEMVWPREIAALEVDTGEWKTVWEGGVLGGERQSWLPRHVQGCEDCRTAVGEGRFDHCSECRDARLFTDGGTVGGDTDRPLTTEYRVRVADTGPRHRRESWLWTPKGASPSEAIELLADEYDEVLSDPDDVHEQTVPAPEKWDDDQLARWGTERERSGRSP